MAFGPSSAIIYGGVTGAVVGHYMQTRRTLAIRLLPGMADLWRPGSGFMRLCGVLASRLFELKVPSGALIGASTARPDQKCGGAVNTQIGPAMIGPILSIGT